MGDLKEFVTERIKATIPEELMSRVHPDWVFPLFGEAVLQAEIAETWKRYKEQIKYKPYTAEFNRKIKLLVRTRDQFTCQICGKTEQELGEVLSAHHINYSKKDSNPINLISLCQRCHATTNGNRAQWEYDLYCKLTQTAGDVFSEELARRIEVARQHLRMIRSRSNNALHHHACPATRSRRG